MSNSAKLLCFLLLLPFFTAIAHDFYASSRLNATNKTRLEIYDIDPKAYQASDFGYIVTTYTPDLFETARGAINERDWIEWVDPVLRLYTFIVALVPAVLFFIWLVIARIFDIWPFIKKDAKATRSQDFDAPPVSRSDLIGRGALFEKKSKKMEYKRR